MPDWYEIWDARRVLAREGLDRIRSVVARFPVGV